MMTTQTCITANIIGNARVGGMLPYTVYRIEVADLNQHLKWFIYRRFSSFLSLYYSLLEEIGESIVHAHHVPIPQKELGGTIGGNRRRIVQKRHRELQIYLNAILTIENIDESSILKAFLDCAYKGSSVCQIEYGQTMIRKESFVKVKRTKFSLIWGNVYIVLMYDYRLFILSSISDSSTQALACVDLTTEDVSIVGMPRRIIAIQRPDIESHILIQYHDDEEYESWLRVMPQGKVNRNPGLTSPGSSILMVPSNQSGSRPTSAADSVRNSRASNRIFSEEDRTDEMAALFGI